MFHIHVLYSYCNLALMQALTIYLITRYDIAVIIFIWFMSFDRHYNERTWYLHFQISSFGKVLIHWSEVLHFKRLSPNRNLHQNLYFGAILFQIQNYLHYYNMVTYSKNVREYIYSTPKETHHLYAFTVVKKFHWR